MRSTQHERETSSLHCIEFESVIGVMQGILDTGLDCKFVFGGDFNVSKLSVNNSFESLDDFCHANRTVWLAHVHDGIADTFHNDVSKRYTLIDYCICSPELTDSSVAGHILDDEDNTSDHLAITCEFVTAGGSNQPCLYDELLSSDSLQYGFKKNSSCSRALFTVSESVRYFTKKGSRVYCTFFDASKAFDNVLQEASRQRCSSYFCTSFEKLVW